jgi:hypothetical protein
MFQVAGSRSLILGSLAIGLAACSGGSSDSGAPPAAADRTNISVSLMDAPVDDVTAVYVQIAALWIKPLDGPAEELPLTESPYTVDLLATSADNAALLVDKASIDPGEYEWLAMDVNAEFDGLVTDSYVVTDMGGEEELRVPSSRIRLVDGFEAEANAALELIFDWDLRKGLVHPPGLGGYLLRPAFRVIDTVAYGGISGTIAMDTVTLAENECDADDSNFDEGNAIYIFSGLDVVPDDIDEEMDVEPLAVINASLTDDMTAYEYRTILPFGDYTVAFTCQAAADLAESNEIGNEDPDDDSMAFFEPAVNVSPSSDSPATANVVVDFPTP